MDDALRGATVLAVGGAGFVGSNLVRRLLAEGVGRVVVVDNFLSAVPENLPDDARVEVVNASIVDDAVLSALADEFAYAFHLATFHGNQSSIERPLEDHENNLLTTLKLYERLKGFQALRRVVYTSTGCALAAKNTDVAEPVREDGPVPLDFDSPYQISKVAGEMYSLYYGHAHGLPVVRVRFQNVYGPGEILGAGRWRGTEHTIWRNVVPTFVYRALKGLPLHIHGDGSATRDFIYVDDVVEGLVRAAVADGAAGDVFNLASGVEVSVGRLAELITGAVGGGEIEYVPTRTWDRSLARVGDPTKARERLGFEAKVPLADGIARTVDWTRANLGMIEQCIRRHEAHVPVEV